MAHPTRMAAVRDGTVYAIELHPPQVEAFLDELAFALESLHSLPAKGFYFRANRVFPTTAPSNSIVA